MKQALHEALVTALKLIGAAWVVALALFLVILPFWGLYKIFWP